MIEEINIYNENNTKYGLKKYNRNTTEKQGATLRLKTLCMSLI